MGIRPVMRVGIVGIGIFALFLISPTFVHAADESSVEAAEVPTATTNVGIEQIRSEIATEEDPELRAAMQEQLQLLESGQLDFQTLEQERTAGTSSGPGSNEAGGGRLANSLSSSSVGLVGPPVETGTGATNIGGNYMPPEARAELEKIFQQGTGDPSKDAALREQAEKVMEKYGIEAQEAISPREGFERWQNSEEGQRVDPATRENYREISEKYQAEFERTGGYESHGGGFERDLSDRVPMAEQMTPEAREHMEQEFGASSERSFEAPTHEYESQTHEYEAPTHEYEAPTREYEATTREYEAPTREYEAPTHEYEAPTHEYEAPEQEAPEYEAPEAPQFEAPEFEAPEQGMGGGFEAPESGGQTPQP
ncbi:MAG: hypothetical protein HYT88_03655 [Candidatus Omnitrophica bacterium]|nr:hypothetical protein [Candidatus Omnitrophota bacterium]